jgi:Universal stress protein family
MSEIFATTIVVGIDYSDASERALAMAWDLAAAAPAAELHIIHVVEKGLADATDGSGLDEEETPRCVGFVARLRCRAAGANRAVRDTRSSAAGTTASG